MPEARQRDVTFELMTQRCRRPAWEPELGKKRKQRIRALPLPAATVRSTELYTLDESGAIRLLTKGSVLPTDKFTGDGPYVIDWQGRAIAVQCRAEPGQ